MLSTVKRRDSAMSVAMIRCRYRAPWTVVVAEVNRMNRAKTTSRNQSMSSLARVAEDRRRWAQRRQGVMGFD